MSLRGKKGAINPRLFKEGVRFNTNTSLEHYLQFLFYYGLSNPGSFQISYHFLQIQYRVVLNDVEARDANQSMIFLVLDSCSRGFLVGFHQLLHWHITWYFQLNLQILGSVDWWTLNLNKKSDNLQYNMLGQWVDCLINQGSDGPHCKMVWVLNLRTRTL